MSAYFFACPVCYDKVLRGSTHDDGTYDTRQFKDNVLHDYHILRDKVADLEKKLEELATKYIIPKPPAEPSADNRFDDIEL